MGSGNGHGKAFGLTSYLNFGRDMNIIVLTLILANIGSSIEGRFFSLYVRDLGGSPTDIGLVGTIAMVFVTLLAPLGGWATDRYRRVTLYSIGPMVGALGELLMILAPRWGWLVPGYLLTVFPTLLVGPALFGLTSDVGPEETRASRYAYVAAASGVCAAIGPVLGGYIYQYLGYREFMAMNAALLFLAGLIRRMVRDPREAARKVTGFQAPSFVAGFKQALRVMASSQQFRVFFVVAALVGFGGAAAGNFFSVFMSEVAHVDQSAMGVVYSLAGVATIVAGLVGGVAADRFGRKPVVGVALFGMAVGFVWFIGARSMAALSAVWLYLGLVGSLPNPGLEALLADMTDQESRGTYRSVFNSLQTLVMLPAPLVGGMLWDALSPTAPFWFAAAVTLAGLLAMVLWMKETKRAGTGAKAAGAGR